MNTKKSIWLIIILAVIIVILAILFFAIPNETKAPSDVGNLSKNPNASSSAQNLKTYQNPTYHYALKYPASLDTKEYLPEDIVFGHVNDDSVDALAESRVENITPVSGETFQNAVTKRMATLCAADGPTGSFSCTDTTSLKPFSTDSGINGFVFYLHGELKNFETTSTTAVEKGPYFAFDLSTSTANGTHQALIIHAPLNQSAKEASTTLITQIASSLTFENSTSSSAASE